MALEEARTVPERTERQSTPVITVYPNGPYHVEGASLVRMRPVVAADGSKVAWDRGPELPHARTFELCRCGASKDMPFCDGTERTIGFDGTESAARGPTAERRSRFGEESLVLTDDRSLCSLAGFCRVADRDAWGLAASASDPAAATELTGMVARCPSGRLALLLNGEAFEAELAKEIAVIEDGPLWVRGGIPIDSAQGFRYEIRNRVTLCRCGHSGNKPFCDGSHKAVAFRDR